jgi:hypothetical protein
MLDIRIIRCVLLSLGLAFVAAAAALGRYRPRHRAAQGDASVRTPRALDPANRGE